MVGKGFLQPNLSIARSDTPKAFRRLQQDCIKYQREERPLFPQVGGRWGEAWSGAEWGRTGWSGAVRAGDRDGVLKQDCITWRGGSRFPGRRDGEVEVGEFEWTWGCTELVSLEFALSHCSVENGCA